MTPGDGLDDLFSGRLHKGWTPAHTRRSALAGLAGAIGGGLEGLLCLTWLATHPDLLAAVILAATGVLVAAGTVAAVLTIAHRTDDPSP